MDTDYYKILGVGRSATHDEIKKNWRALTMKYHPDRVNESRRQEATAKMIQINEAWEFLGNQKKRQQYDLQQLNPFANSMPNIPGMSGMHGIPGMPIPPELFEMISRGLFGGEMPQVFHMSTGGPMNMGQGNPMNMGQGNPMNMGQGNPMNMHSPIGSMGRGTQQPEPIQKKLEISLEEAFSGKTKQISVPRTIMRGGSRRLENETLYISIPNGVDTDEIITIKNKGNIVNNIRGDVNVVITVKNFTKFTRQGIDLIYNKDISLKEALCGFNFDMEYIDGRVFKIKNDSGNIISSGYNKIIQKMGMVRGKIKGDLIIKFNVLFPDKLSEAQIKSINEIL